MLMSDTLQDTKVCNLRESYARTLCDFAQFRDDFLVLDSDSKEPTKVDQFYKANPHMCISFGIAEQNMVSAAAGMSTIGFIPFVNSYAQFVSMRALDQIRNSIAYPNVNVKIVVSHYGLDVGKDGVTHQTIEDISIMRAIPNMTILNPLDDIECVQMVKYCFDHHGPIYLRTGKSSVPRIHDEDFQFEVGKPDVIIKGTDNISIVVTGNVMKNVLGALDKLAATGVRPHVINMSTLKPIDENSLLNLTQSSDVIFTVEDHNVYGGLGSIIAELHAAKCPKRVIRIGVNDVFAEAGTGQELYDKYGMNAQSIADCIIKEINLPV